MPFEVSKNATAVSSCGEAVDVAATIITAPTSAEARPNREQRRQKA